jgi:hypothetical protein
MKAYRSLLLFAVTLTPVNFCFCQSWEWVSYAYVTASATKTYCMDKDTRGNVFVGGMVANVSTFGGITVSAVGSNDAFIAKIDSAGNWLWIKTGGAAGTFSQTYAIATDKDDNVYIAGTFRDSIVLGPFTFYQPGLYEGIFVAKLDSAGGWVWANEIQASILAVPKAIAVDDYGNCYVGGYFCGSAFADSLFITSPNNYSDALIAKLDTAGNWIDVTTAGDTGNDQVVDLACDSAGNIFATGEFINLVYFDTLTLKSVGNQDIFIAKLDSSLGWKWVKKFGGKYDDEAECVAFDGDTTLYFSGHFIDTAYFDSDTLVSMGTSDTYIIESDLAGNISWLKQLGIVPYSEIKDISIKPDKNLFVAGSYYDSLVIGTTTLSNAIPNFHLFIAELGSNASWLWSLGSINSYQVLNGSYAQADARACTHSNNNEVYFSGTGGCGIVLGNDSISLVSFLFVAKINSLATAIATPAITANEISVYPNPFSESISILTNSKKYDLIIFDITGNMVYTSRCENTNRNVQLNNLKSGIYFVQISSGNNAPVMKKIVKQ